MSIPDSNFQDNEGSFNISALPIPNSTEIYFAMSDATGPVSGGTSRLMTVGDPLSGQHCNTTALGTIGCYNVAVFTNAMFF